MRVMNATQRINKIIKTIKAGKTVYVHTATKATKITPKTFDQFEKSGRPLLIARNDSMFMSNGDRYDCIDFCKFTTDKV
jgi:hypothetical protein